jgi:alpha-1,6-mannosyltransferase
VWGAGLVCLALVAAAASLAWPAASPLTPDHQGATRTSWSWAYLVLVAAGFVAYLGGLALLRRRACARTTTVLAIAFAIQLAPLAAPVLLSTDVYTYWDYGRLSAVHGANPYTDRPDGFANDPAFKLMGAQWRDTTSVYGPAFTLASEAHAAGVGESSAAAAWTYKVAAAVALVALAWLAARLGSAPAFAAAFVGWNPLLAVHFAGGGHNDAWMMALVVGAIALAAAGRRNWAGAAWAAAVAVKWVALVFLPLRALEARRHGRRVGHAGFAAGALVIVAFATWRYGRGWLDAFGPVARNLQEGSNYSIPSRLERLGVPHGAAVGLLAGLFALAYVWLLLEAWRGRARLALAGALLVVAAPWLVPWYAVWAVPLAAIEEDGTARVLALALSAYLLRDAVPL